MRRVLVEPNFNAWRVAAREALHAGYRPEEIDLEDAAFPSPLNLALEADVPPGGTPIARPHTSKAFLEAAELAAVHRDPGRWNLLYRILYRLQDNRDLLRVETDPDVADMLRLTAQVRRDLHKMHAFVRFHKVLKPEEALAKLEQRPVVLDEPLVPATPEHPDPHHLVLATETPFGITRIELEPCEPPSVAQAECEHFIAWYQPDHRILPLAASFFAERFAILHWSILTPDGSVAWDPETKRLAFAAGLPREAAAPPEPDELEDLWRTYYASIFNPARLNPSAMRSEMPVRYWKELPEIAQLPSLITQARTRVNAMVTRQQQQPNAAPFVPQAAEGRNLSVLAAELQACRGCDLYCHATQAVPGQGDVTSSLLLVGEQPGDQEDLQGLPFVGPAGKVLDRALDELRLDRSKLYLTNAVKHFKFVQRGKLRLHQNPRMSEIMACRPWLLAEIEVLRPKVVLCLGASASKSLLGGSFALMRDRGKLIETPFASQVMATIHPSAILRARDQATGHQLFAFLKEDLAAAHRAAMA